MRTVKLLLRVTILERLLRLCCTYKAKRFIEQLINLTVFTIFRRRRHAHAPTLYLRLPSRT